jgi:hypothetical protein
MAEEGDHDDRRFRARMLQRWRFSVVMAFASGVMVTMVAYPRISPCADLHKVAAAAAARCPACPACVAGPTDSMIQSAVNAAVSRCPTCPRCPDFPSCPQCPATQNCPPAPACPTVSCPAGVTPQLKEPDAVVAARHRDQMLSRGVGANIIECSADAKDDSCRMCAIAHCLGGGPFAAKCMLRRRTHASPRPSLSQCMLRRRTIAAPPPSLLSLSLSLTHSLAHAHIPPESSSLPPPRASMAHAGRRRTVTRFSSRRV